MCNCEKPAVPSTDYYTNELSKVAISNTLNRNLSSAHRRAVSAVALSDRYDNDDSLYSRYPIEAAAVYDDAEWSDFSGFSRVSFRSFSFNVKLGREKGGWGCLFKNGEWASPETAVLTDYSPSCSFSRVPSAETPAKKKASHSKPTILLIRFLDVSIPLALRYCNKNAEGVNAHMCATQNVGLH